jgi:hypothetical protein
MERTAYRLVMLYWSQYGAVEWVLGKVSGARAFKSVGFLRPFFRE